MKRLHSITLAATALFIGATAPAFAENDALTDRQKSIVKISAFTATGNIDELSDTFEEGLEAGLTTNEIKEIIVHLYAYTGFPRALNSQTAFMKLMNERKAAGITDVEGKSASPVPENFDRDAYGAKVRATLSGLEEVPPPAAWQEFSPIMDEFLKEHLFADIFVRDILDFKTRELVTVAALASMSGTEGQLTYHLNAAMNVGNSAEELEGAVSLIRKKVDKKQGRIAERVLESVLEKRN